MITGKAYAQCGVGVECDEEAGYYDGSRAGWKRECTSFKVLMATWV